MLIGVSVVVAVVALAVIVTFTLPIYIHIVAYQGMSLPPNVYD